MRVYALACVGTPGLLWACESSTVRPQGDSQGPRDSVTSDTGVDPDDGSGGDTAGDSGGDTGDSGVEWHGCSDLPWTAVEVGYEVACGIHTDGCLDCWGTDDWGLWPHVIYDEPSIDAVDVSLRAAWTDDKVDSSRPFACAQDVFGQWTCWGEPPTEDDSFPPVENASAVEVGDYFVAALSAEGLLQLYGWSNVIEVENVGGELSVGTSTACAVQANDLWCWDEQATVPAIDVGAAADWRQYAMDINSLAGIREDGAVVSVSVPGNVEETCAPAGSPWTTVRRGYCHAALVTDADGYVYELATAEAGPVLAEPVVMFDVASHGMCGVTLDGWLECTGDFVDTFPPPGSYVIGDAP